MPEFSKNKEWGILCLKISACVAIGGVALLCLMLLAFTLPLFASGGGTPFSWEWNIVQGKFGILPMALSSLALGSCAMLLAFPFGMGLCFWLVCPAKPPCKGRDWSRFFVGGIVRVMTAIPTVVYGFAAVFLLTPVVRTFFGGSGFCFLSAVLMLALLILPTIVLVMQAGVENRLNALLLQGLALGMDRMELAWHIVLPASRKTLLSAAVLGFGRAVGDTMLPLMLAGNAPVLPQSMLSGMRTLTSHMALVTANEVGGSAYQSLFMAGVLLILINGIVSLAVARMKGGLG